MKSLIIENENLFVEIIPSLGGRVDKLVNKSSNYNWVWNNPFIQKKIIEHGVDYDSNWQGGWEELFPNDAIEKFSWGYGNDHGDLWNHSWKIIDYSSNTIHLSTGSLGNNSSIDKVFYLNENKLRVNYKISIEFSDWYLFKLHLAIPIREKLEIKNTFKSIEKVDSEFGNIINTINQENFFNLTENSNFFDFGYLENLNDFVELKSKDNYLKIYYDKKFFKYLWIFQTQGSWNNHNVVVVEPASNGRKEFIKAKQKNQIMYGPSDIETFFEIEAS